MNYENFFDEDTLKAIKSLANGLTVTEVVAEYATDKDGDMKMVKKKVSKKTLPPNTDIIKLFYSNSKDETSKYKDMTDDELEKEKHRLLLELKKENIDADRENNA